MLFDGAAERRVGLNRDADHIAKEHIGDQDERFEEVGRRSRGQIIARCDVWDVPVVSKLVAE